MERGCDQRSVPEKAGADELEADRQKASPIRNVAKHLATRPGHRSPAHGTTRSVPARGRSDRSEQQPPDRGPMEARPKCCTRCASVGPRRCERTRAPGKRHRFCFGVWTWWLGQTIGAPPNDDNRTHARERGGTRETREIGGQSLWRWKAGEIEDSITPTPGQKTRSFATYAEFESQ